MKKILEHLSAQSFPEKNIVIDTLIEQLENKKDEKEIMTQMIVFLSTLCEINTSTINRQAVKQIQEGLKILGLNKSWTLLQGVAKEASESCLLSFTLKDKCPDIEALFQVKLAMNNASIPEALEMLDREWVKKNYPALKKKE